MNGREKRKGCALAPAIVAAMIDSCHAGMYRDMNILLLSMPDSFEHMPAHGMRMPVASLTSLAGNVDAHHKVAAADLILVQRRVRESVEQLVRRFEPGIVGLSVMTFQRRSARRIIDLVRSLRPAARIVAGGYDPSLAPEAYIDAADFVVRGEGEITFRELVRSLESGGGFPHIPGLSYRAGVDCFHNPARPPSSLDGDEIRPPNRGARVLKGYTLMGRPVDVVETSRGCTFGCSFCSIVAMRGRNFHTYALDRVLADIRDAWDRGARVIFLVDDNITLDVPRFEDLCRALIAARLNKADFIVQAMTSAIANHGRTLAPLMRRAGFRYVFLGIENVLETDLKFLRARPKNEERAHGRLIGNATVRAIEHLHRNGLYVVGGLIVGNPDDTRASIEANLEFARRHVDWPYIQHPTPYPGTPISEEFRTRGLIVSERMEEYDGTTAVVRSEHLAADDIEFMRWRAERWMKVRHMPAAFLHSPLFVMRTAHRMLGHTFRGATLKSFVGMESDRVVFDRYRALRSAERHYL
jgi:anaerobic magnesium-protoporphyrin IX monomethyl ester cyclase